MRFYNFQPALKKWDGEARQGIGSEEGAWDLGVLPQKIFEV